MRGNDSMKRTVRREARLMKIAAALMVAGLFLALWGSAGWATSEAEGGHQEAHHEVHFGKETIYQFVNFILLCGLLLYVYRKNASGAFEQRSLEIQTAMEDAAKAKKAAEDKYLEYQARIAQLDEEIAKILELAREDGIKERDSIIEEAKRQSEKIVQQADMTAKQEVLMAKQELRREAAELAAGLAAEAIKKAMKPEDQRNWVKAYIDKIGEVQ